MEVCLCYQCVCCWYIEKLLIFVSFSIQSPCLLRVFLFELFISFCLTLVVYTNAQICLFPLTFFDSMEYRFKKTYLGYPEFL